MSFILLTVAYTPLLLDIVILPYFLKVAFIFYRALILHLCHVSSAARVRFAQRRNETSEPAPAMRPLELIQHFLFSFQDLKVNEREQVVTVQIQSSNTGPLVLCVCVCQQLHTSCSHELMTVFYLGVRGWGGGGAVGVCVCVCVACVHSSENEVVPLGARVSHGPQTEMISH